MSDGDAKFAAALHQAMQPRAGNLAYSPASVRIALAMAAAGARRETAAEMYAALALPEGEAGHSELGATLAGWAALAAPPSAPPAADASAVRPWQEEQLERKRVVLRLANRLWAQQGHPLRGAFTNLLDEIYRAPLGTVDFRHDAARVTINRWVAEATDQKIKDLLANRIAPDTKLVITNAVYFKARWRSPFEPRATAQQPFFTGDGHSVAVPLMRETAHFKLARIDGAMMLELPYGDGRLVMDVVLPSARGVGAPQGLREVEAAYGKGELDAWVSALGPARVDVSLPRFRAASSLELVNELRAVGIVRAFEYPGADFSGIDGTTELFIGNVVHQAFVAVDENGTEAAAATAVVARAGAALVSDPPVVFRADHPFLFFIRDSESKVVLFAGRLVDPGAT
ncbi:MAG TPA: serpin family protein [Polyangia bacterium]|nr:serpin family protein [Polyangia bacterium]